MSLTPQTHLAIASDWVGEIVGLEQDRAEVRLATRPEMVADDRGLVHGGFAFGLADYAAMLAVNDPNVVLGSSTVKFLAPVRLGDVLFARAEVIAREGRKCRVSCEVVTDRTVVSGEFVCYVLDRHILAEG